MIPKVMGILGTKSETSYTAIWTALRMGGRTRADTPTLKYCLFCGEGLPIKVARFWKQLSSTVQLFNLYGPTECTVACSLFECSDDYLNFANDSEFVPIGQVFGSLDFYVEPLKGSSTSAPGTGELCIAGSQVFSGYLNQELNSTPFLYHSGKTFYRTGDIVKLQAGHLHFQGRGDRQVKVSGYRIELGELESAARSIQGVVFASANLQESGTLSLAIFGYGLEESKIQDQLSKKLASYAMPKSIRIVPVLPVSTNGKTQFNHTQMRDDHGTSTATL
jgi:acyl-coenzyme A synthetase/AMP-(fatty) acid ligase